MRPRCPQPDKLPLKCLTLCIGSRISCCASRTFACRVALNDRTHIRPQDAAEQTECDSGKKKDHTVKNVLLVNALLLILFLSDTYGGRVHDKRIVDATPYPLPTGSRLLQDLGFLAFTLPHVEILMPTKKPRGQDLTLEQELAN